MSARIAALISGRGSNLLAIHDACRDGRLDAEVVLVLSNRPDAAGLEIAAERGIPTEVVDHRAFAERPAFDRAIGKSLLAASPDWIVLAGFMRVLGAELVSQWSGRMLNIHPSLLPRHPGLDTHQKVLDAGDTEHGASVHLVTPELDAGPIVAQSRIPVLSGDTATTLSERLLPVEHALYVDALAHCLSGDAPADQLTDVAADRATHGARLATSAD